MCETHGGDSTKKISNVLRKNFRKGAVYLLVIGISAMLCVPVLSSNFVTTNEDSELKNNHDTWKKRSDYTEKVLKCQEALEWVKSNGMFAPAGSGKGFDQAMSLPGDRSLREAFRIEKLLGILAQESSFGTKFSETGNIVGPFQLSEDAVKDYNHHNGTTLKYPDDVNGADDFDAAAKVAAWYLAYLLQQLTWTKDGLTAVQNPDEANKFALAAYNGGLRKINDARKAAKNAGKDPNKWNDVKNYLPQGDPKSTEIKEYVEKVRGYEDLFRKDVISWREEVKNQNSRIELEVKTVPDPIDGKYPYRWRYRITRTGEAKIKDFCIDDVPDNPEDVKDWGNWEDSGWKRTVTYNPETKKWRICWETETPVDSVVVGFDQRWGLGPAKKGKSKVSYDTIRDETNNITVPRDEPPPETPEVNGGDPPIYQNIMVFPTPERFHRSDLNNDGDTLDIILRYWNLETNEVINTGMMVSGAHHAIDIYENIIVFIGDGSHIYYYDISTKAIGETGGSGFHPSIYGDTITFVSGGTICYYNYDTETLVDTEIQGENPAIYEDLIVFHAGQDPTIWIYDYHEKAAFDTGVMGMNAAIYEDLIAFERSENSVLQDINGDGDTSDWVICCYDLETKITTHTNAVGIFPAIYQSFIAFTTPEDDINQDLNGDDKICGKVIRYYDLRTSQVINTQKLGTEPDIYGVTITYYLWEHWAGRDLDGDGDWSDPIIRTYQITATEMTMTGSEMWLFPALLVIGCAAVYLKRK